MLNAEDKKRGTCDGISFSVSSRVLLQSMLSCRLVRVGGIKW